MYFRGVSLTLANTDYVTMGEVDPTIPPSSLILKLAVTNDSIRYFVQSVTHSQIVFFASHTLHHVDGEDDLFNRLQRIFEREDVLQLSYSKVLLGVNSHYSLLPADIDFTHLNEDEITVRQRISIANLDMVFPVGLKLLNKVNSLFRRCEILHLSSSLLNILPYYLQEEHNKLFVNVDFGEFEVIRFNDDGYLQLMNRYPYKTASDLLYFLSLCAEELKLDREVVDLVLIGEVDMQSEIYALCYEYFRNIDFVQQPMYLYFTRAFDLLPKHLHFNLYNLSE